MAAIRGIAMRRQVSELSAAMPARSRAGQRDGEISSSVQAVAAGTSAVTDGIGALSGLADRTGQAAEKVAGATAEVTRQTTTARGEVGRFLAAVKAA